LYRLAGLTPGAHGVPMSEPSSVEPQGLEFSFAQAMDLPADLRQDILGATQDGAKRSAFDIVSANMAVEPPMAPGLFEHSRGAGKFLLQETPAILENFKSGFPEFDAGTCRPEPPSAEQPLLHGQENSDKQSSGPSDESGLLQSKLPSSVSRNRSDGIVGEALDDKRNNVFFERGLE